MSIEVLVPKGNEARSGKRRSEECRSGDGHLEWPPRIMGFIHARKCARRK